MLGLGKELVKVVYMGHTLSSLDCHPLDRGCVSKGFMTINVQTPNKNGDSILLVYDI